MPAYECLICGTSVYSLGRSHRRCHICGGEHFHASLPGQSTSRFPQVFHQGDHASLMYTDDARLCEVVVPYLQAGLTASQQVVAVFDEQVEGLLCSRLEPGEAEAIEWVRPADVYGLPLDADKTLAGYEQRMNECERPIRVAGGFDRTVASSIDLAELARLEQGGEKLFERGLTGLCVYDARYCPRGLLAIAADHRLLTGRDAIHLSAA